MKLCIPVLCCTLLWHVLMSFLWRTINTVSQSQAKMIEAEAAVNRQQVNFPPTNPHARDRSKLNSLVYNGTCCGWITVCWIGKGIAHLDGHSYGWRVRNQSENWNWHSPDDFQLSHFSHIQLMGRLWTSEDNDKEKNVMRKSLHLNLEEVFDDLF